MKIPLKTFAPAIDFNPFMRDLEEKYGFNHRDMAGKFSKEAYDEYEKLKAVWLEQNGYADKEYVLEKPEGSKQDWPKDSEEMKLRIEINTKMGKEVDGWLNRPYQDVWHWLLDNDFVELRRGGINYLWLDEERLTDEETPAYVRTVLKAIYVEVKDHEAYDGEHVRFHVDW